MSLGAAVDRVARHLPPPERALVWLVAAHLVLKLLVYPLAMQAPPYGDEQQYFDGARALSNYLRDLFALEVPDAHEVEANVVASGWFMPGMSVLMTPLFLLVPDASEPLSRAYLGLVNLVVLLWAVRSVRRHLGPGYAALVVVFPALLPSWALMTFTAYGDPVSGLVLVALVAHVVDVLRTLRRGDAPGWREAVRLGLLAIAVLYLRSSTLPVLGAVAAVTVLAAAVLLRGAARRRALVQVGLAGAVFLALLAPWSLAASQVLGTRVVTTTTVPVSLAQTFGEEEQLCFGPCDPDSPTWFKPLRYSREVARAAGVSEVEVQQQMSDFALRDLDRDGYARQAWWNTGAYFLIPANFVRYITPPEGRGPVGEVGERVAWVTTYLLYLPVLLAMLASMFAVPRRSLEARLLDVVTKLCLGALFVQPFVHIAGSRYWTTAGPLFVIAAASFLRERQVRRREGPEPPERLTGVDARLGRWLAAAQRTLVAATVAVAVVLGLLAI